MNRMFTTCPNCRMHLAVTPVDLRIGQGYVRCGRCERVFNALLSLSEEVDSGQASGLKATGTTSLPAMDDAAMPSPDPVAPADLVLEEEEWSRITPIRQPVTTALDLDLVESQSTGTFETIVLEGDGFLQTEEHVDENDVDEQLQKIARQMDDAEDQAQDEQVEGMEVDEMSGENLLVDYDDVESPELDAEEALGSPPRAHPAWIAAAIALLLLLTGQIMHHHRQSLVARPWFEQPLKSVYGWFGVRLEPRWDLKAYDLRQLGGEAIPGNAETIVLKASVHNRSANSQPPPMIRAVLQDRFGNALSTTAITPQEYLRGKAPSRMSPDQRLDGELRLPDPTRQAVGFELDACLPGADEKLHCSTDP